MPVRKFRTFEQASRALWMDSTDPKLYGAIRSVLATASWVEPLAFPRGVQRFRSIEDADEQREKLLTDRIRRIQATRFNRQI